MDVLVVGTSSRPQDFCMQYGILTAVKFNYRCTRGCVVECQICNLRVQISAWATLQPSIPPGSVNEYQLQLGRQRQVWLIPIADERLGAQVKL